ncbi:MAG: UbiA family prenyltransferase, partial [Candidatus Micrarchaeota archaeon]|nr:UbiA family prenyltransferase [Candidatus Micrarchaeota archaeon]
LAFQFASPDFSDSFLSFCQACSGVSPGLRAEVALVMLAALGYVRFATGSWLRAALAAVFVYGMVVLAALFPGYLMAFFGHATTDVFLFREVASAFTVFSTLVFLAVLAKQTVFFKRLRLERSLHYVGLTLLGAYLGRAAFAHPFPGVLMPLLALVFSVFLAFEAAVWLNDAADAKADRFSASRRAPLPSDALPMVAALSFFSLLNGLAAGFGVLILVATAFALSVPYSLSPLRLSRHFVSAGLVIAVCSVFVFLAGYGVGWLEPETLFASLPAKALAAVFSLVFLASCIKDVKDRKTDQKLGRFTLPVWLGDARARKGIAAMVFFATLASAHFFSFPILAAAVFGGLASACVLLVQSARRMELCVFGFEFLYLLAVAIVS